MLSVYDESRYARAAVPNDGKASRNSHRYSSRVKFVRKRQRERERRTGRETEATKNNTLI